MTQQRRHFFLDVDDDVSLPQIFAEARIVTLQLLHFFRHGIALGLGPALLRSQGLPDPMGSLSPPIGQQRGVQTFATEKVADGAGCGGSRLCFLQDVQFVFRSVATPLGSGHHFGVRTRGRQGAGTTPKELPFISSFLFLALLIN